MNVHNTNMEPPMKRQFEDEAEVAVKRFKIDTRTILEFSDCVLLKILAYLSSYDLYCLSKTCLRFKYLIADRELWKKFNVLDHPMCARKFKVFCDNVHNSTESILVSGINKKEKTLKFSQFLRFNRICENLTILAIENQYINSDEICLKDFPGSLKELSLKSTHIYGRKPFLQDGHLKLFKLHTLILDDCKWFHEHSLMALSKLRSLENLSLYKCANLNDSVAYMSITAKFGFRKLLRIDARLTSIGDQFLKCFHCIRTLREIYLEAPARRAPRRQSDREQVRSPSDARLLSELQRLCHSDAVQHVVGPPGASAVVFNHAHVFRKRIFRGKGKKPKKAKPRPQSPRVPTFDCMGTCTECSMETCSIMPVAPPDTSQTSPAGPAAARANGHNTRTSRSPRGQPDFIQMKILANFTRVDRNQAVPLDCRVARNSRDNSQDEANSQETEEESPTKSENSAVNSREVLQNSPQSTSSSSSYLSRFSPTDSLLLNQIDENVDNSPNSPMDLHQNNENSEKLTEKAPKQNLDNSQHLPMELQLQNWANSLDQSFQRRLDFDDCSVLSHSPMRTEWNSQNYRPSSSRTEKNVLQKYPMNLHKKSDQSDQNSAQSFPMNFYRERNSGYFEDSLSHNYQIHDDFGENVQQTPMDLHQNEAKSENSEITYQKNEKITEKSESNLENGKISENSTVCEQNSRNSEIPNQENGKISKSSVVLEMSNRKTSENIAVSQQNSDNSQIEQYPIDLFQDLESAENSDLFDLSSQDSPKKAKKSDKFEHASKNSERSPVKSEKSDLNKNEGNSSNSAVSDNHRYVTMDISEQRSSSHSGDPEPLLTIQQQFINISAEAHSQHRYQRSENSDQHMKRVPRGKNYGKSYKHCKRFREYGKNIFQNWHQGQLENSQNRENIVEQSENSQNCNQNVARSENSPKSAQNCEQSVGRSENSQNVGQARNSLNCEQNVERSENLSNFEKNVTRSENLQNVGRSVNSPKSEENRNQNVARSQNSQNCDQNIRRSDNSQNVGQTENSPKSEQNCEHNVEPSDNSQNIEQRNGRSENSPNIKQNVEQSENSQNCNQNVERSENPSNLQKNVERSENLPNIQKNIEQSDNPLNSAQNSDTSENASKPSTSSSSVTPVVKSSSPTSPETELSWFLRPDLDAESMVAQYISDCESLRSPSSRSVSPEEMMYCDDVSDTEEEDESMRTPRAGAAALVELQMLQADVTDSGMQWFLGAAPDPQEEEGSPTTLFHSPYHAPCTCGATPAPEPEAGAARTDGAGPSGVRRTPFNNVTFDLSGSGGLHVQIEQASSDSDSEPALPPREATAAPRGPRPRFQSRVLVREARPRPRDLRVIIERLDPGVHIVLDRPGRAPRRRPATRLKVFVARGYRHVTDDGLRSLLDLRLRLLDVTGTGVTAAGIHDFLLVNPDCRVVHETTCSCNYDS